jgi:hypothetical protein
LEDEGNYLEAFTVYLQDSKSSLKQRSLVSAALSCSCAGNCIANAGNLVAARILYLQAGQIYEQNGDYVIGHSVREALWSYQESYEYFTLACENLHAKNVSEKFVSLSRKVNPFFGEKEAMDSLRMRKLDLELNSVSKTCMQISADVDMELSNFLHEIKDSLINLSHTENSNLKTKVRGETFEKSITN